MSVTYEHTGVLQLCVHYLYPSIIYHLSVCMCMHSYMHTFVYLILGPKSVGIGLFETCNLTPEGKEWQNHVMALKASIL